MPPQARSPWPFSDPEDTIVFTMVQILDGLEPILLVTHDIEDDAWQFLPGHDQFTEDDARAVSFAEMLSLDSSIALLADLPIGWSARRKAAYLPWVTKNGVTTES